MPVWHARTKELVAAGRLRVLGITQEQHPDRCRLFCQWQGIDWPVLWDPFNLTGSKAVPHFTLVDAHGVVRKRRAKPGDLAAFLATDFPAPTDPHRPPKGPREFVVEALGNEPVDEAWERISAPLWNRSADPTPLIEVLDDPGDGSAAFRRGVALRMRHDSAFARRGDFQRALDAWRQALALRPGQYIWRRRIQQYGPRPDKPYPFYDWVARATHDVTARGEVPIALPVPLSSAERSSWDAGDAAEEEPDPRSRIPEASGQVTVEAAIAWDTSGRSREGRVHVRVGLAKDGDATWTADAGPLVAWVEAPEGWALSRQRLEIQPPSGPDDDRGARSPLLLECTVEAPAGARRGPVFEGYVLAPLCRSDGTCVVMRQEFEVVIDAAPPRRKP